MSEPHDGRSNRSEGEEIPEEVLDRLGHQETPEPRGPDWVLPSFLGEVIDAYPDWRIVSHTTIDGRKVSMIEYADDDGDFMPYLPSAFVSLISRHGTEEAVTDTGLPENVELNQEGDNE